MRARYRQAGKKRIHVLVRRLSPVCVHPVKLPVHNLPLLFPYRRRSTLFLSPASSSVSTSDMSVYCPVFPFHHLEETAVELVAVALGALGRGCYTRKKIRNQRTANCASSMVVYYTPLDFSFLFLPPSLLLFPGFASPSFFFLLFFFFFPLLRFLLRFSAE